MTDSVTRPTRLSGSAVATLCFGFGADRYFGRGCLAPLTLPSKLPKSGVGELSQINPVRFSHRGAFCVAGRCAHRKDSYLRPSGTSVRFPVSQEIPALIPTLFPAFSTSVSVARCSFGGRPSVFGLIGRRRPAGGEHSDNDWISCAICQPWESNRRRAEF